ncbi:energy transducer TonB [Marivita sp.]|uniref:energy transducer TonB n=1 Tax=Marivita sp. TaxID=2003365 RepID=UPI0025C0A2D5|nr:energy transducer TonB [Marivita sp.]
MNTGQIISGAGHLALMGWALFGGAFQSEPLPFQVTEVTAISAEEFAALSNAPNNPEAVANVDTPEPPAEGEGVPELSATEDATPEMSQPEASETPPADTVPEPQEPPAPLPEAEVSDAPPVLTPPEEDVAALVPEVSPRPQPRPAPRVAPEPVAQPDPDVEIDEVDQQETTPDAEAAETVKEDTRETAREEATTEIVTEAEENDLASAAPTRSPRPRTRPETPATEAEPTQDAPAPSEPETDENAVNNALAEALGQGQAQTGGTDQGAPSGPPLTAGEKDALRVAVQNCWNVGSLSSEALRTTVVVSVTMSEDSRPVTSSIEMLSASGGSGSAAKQAYEAARRAIIRCGASGFNLPKDKYDHWRDIEMTFNPERMRIK